MKIFLFICCLGFEIQDCFHGHHKVTCPHSVLCDMARQNRQLDIEIGYFCENMCLHSLSLDFEIQDGIKVESIHHSHRLAALCLFLLLIESNPEYLSIYIIYNIQILKYSNTQILKCSNTQIQKYSNSQILTIATDWPHFVFFFFSKKAIPSI